MAPGTGKRERLARPAAVLLILLSAPLAGQPGASRRLWRFAMPVTVVQSPAVGSDGTIYIGTGFPDIGPKDDTLYAVRSDGTLKWKRPMDRAVHSSVALDGEDNLYFLSVEAGGTDLLDAAVVSIDSSGSPRWTSGAIGWQSPIYLTGYTPAIASDGTVYACGRYALFALNRDGTTRWRFDFPLRDSQTQSGTIETTGSLHSGPTVGPDGTIYVNTMAGGHGRESVEGGVFAIAPDGTLKWRTFDIGGTAAPVIGADGTVYSAVGRYEDYADTSDWTRASREAKILAIHPDGTPKWSVETGLWIQASPSIGADGTLYAGTTHHPLGVPAWFYAVSPDGRIKWKYDTADDVKDLPPAQTNPPDIYNSPAIDSNGRVYFGNEVGLLYALSPDGETAWIDRDIWSLHDQGPALEADGTLVVATHSPQGLIAFATGSRGLADSAWPKFRRNSANTGNAAAPEPPNSVRRPVPPISFDLAGAYPNPFNPGTAVVFRLASAGRARVEVFDCSGAVVAVLADGWFGAGRREVRWDGRDRGGREVPAGVYLVRISASAGGPPIRKTGKLCLVR
jgi:outer membrane protein assembly factor BamB